MTTAPDSPTIALVGAGEYLEACRIVDAHLLDLLAARDVGRPRVVVLPTASSTEGERVWRGWADRGVAWFSGLGAATEAALVIDRVDADSQHWAEVVASADLVYLSGGKPTHLYDTLAGTAVWRAIEGVVAGGGILAGCSAGAMIQGERIAGIRSGRDATPGFGLLPGTVVLPHFDEFPSMISKAVSKLVGRGQTVVGIDGGTALVRHEGSFRAVGTGRVSVFAGSERAVFRDEEIPADVVGSSA